LPNLRKTGLASFIAGYGDDVRISPAGIAAMAGTIWPGQTKTPGDDSPGVF
jgi:hypothetical protein